MRPACILIFTAMLSLGTVELSPATAAPIATRQVSTGDLTPMLYGLVHQSDEYDPIVSTPYRHVQLFNAVVDNGSLAFITSASKTGSVIHAAYDGGQSGVYLIDDLTPDLHTDGITNRNVQPIITGHSDSEVGRTDDLSEGSGGVLFPDFRPNGLALGNGRVSFATLQDGATNYGLFEGGSLSLSDVNTANNTVPSLKAIADPGTTIDGESVNNAVAMQSISRDLYTLYNLARDGDRTVFEAVMDNNVRSLVSYDSSTGNYQTLFRTGGGANPAINLPDGESIGDASRVLYVDADGGEVVIVRGSRYFGGAIYHLDAANNASVLVSAPGEELGQVAIDNGEVVVGRHDNILDAYNPHVTTRARGERNSTSTGLFPDQYFLGPRYEAIARFDEATDSLIDLVGIGDFMPGGGPAFAGLGHFAYSDGNLAFLGSGESGPDEAGLFVLYEGVLHEILKFGDTFDGKTVKAVDIHRDGLDGDLLAFTVTFSAQIDQNGYILDQSIYTMSLSENFPVPEPASLALLGACGWLYCLRRPSTAGQ